MEIEATVIECLPNLTYRVATDEVVGIKSKELMCYLAGRMKMNKIKVMLGDRVRVVLDPHGGKATNRITRRL
jgi:translation initiation factor IF-1